MTSQGTAWYAIQIISWGGIRTNSINIQMIGRDFLSSLVLWSSHERISNKWEESRQCFLIVDFTSVRLFVKIWQLVLLKTFLNLHKGHWTVPWFMRFVLFFHQSSISLKAVYTTSFLTLFKKKIDGKTFILYIKKPFCSVSSFIPVSFSPVCYNKQVYMFLDTSAVHFSL